MDFEGPGGGNKKGGGQGIKRKGRKRRGSSGSGVEKRGSLGTGFVMLNRLSRLMFSLSPLPLCGQHNSQSQGNRLRGFDLLNFREGAA